MTIEKAIEILTNLQKGTWPRPNSDLDIATGLGIEAMKREKRLRGSNLTLPLSFLPGETQD